MIRILFMLTSVSLRYFKADWDESKYILIKKKIELWLKKEIHDMCYELKPLKLDKRTNSYIRVNTRELDKEPFIN